MIICSVEKHYRSNQQSWNIQNKLDSRFNLSNCGASTTSRRHWVSTVQVGLKVRPLESSRLIEFCLGAGILPQPMSTHVPVSAHNYRNGPGPSTAQFGRIIREVEASGPPFGVFSPQGVFALGPAYSRSLRPLTRPFRLINDKRPRTLHRHSRVVHNIMGESKLVVHPK